MSDKLAKLMGVIQSAIADTKEVSAALRPSDLGLRGGDGTIVILFEDGEKMRLNVRDATPKGDENAESD